MDLTREILTAESGPLVGCHWVPQTYCYQLFSTGYPLYEPYTAFYYGLLSKLGAEVPKTQLRLWWWPSQDVPLEYLLSKSPCSRCYSAVSVQQRSLPGLWQTFSLPVDTGIEKPLQKHSREKALCCVGGSSCQLSSPGE